MAQYIDKDALVAEIERRVTEGEKVSKEVPSSAIMGLIQAYKNTLSLIDTLEVKEVDLEAELSNYIKHYRSIETGYTIFGVAKHFFELGIKAQKGE